MATFEFLSSPRVLRGAPATIWLATYLDGVPTAPASAGTVTITDQDGTAVASGSATIANQRLEYTMTAAQAASSNLLTASWATVVMGASPAVTLTSYHELVGDLLFTLGEARAFDNAALKSETLYPNDNVWAARDQIWDAFEDILGYPLGGRIQREVLGGDGDTSLWLRWPTTATVRAISERTASTQTWTAYTAAELLDVLGSGRGKITRESLGYFTVGNNNIRITYEAGAVPIPRELRTAALMVARNQLVPSALPDRATSMTSELGTFQLSTPGVAPHWFGLPNVDSVLARLQAKVPGFA